MKDSDIPGNMVEILQRFFFTFLVVELPNYRPSVLLVLQTYFFLSILYYLLFYYILLYLSLIKLVKELKNGNKFNTSHIVKTIRCDNAGENKKLKELNDIEGLGIIYEFTGPGSPQFNGRVERKFATLFARVRSMLNGAKLPITIRNRLWAAAAKTATNIENILVSYNKPKSSFNVFYKTDEVGPRPLKPFGDIAIVEYNQTRKIRSKLADRGRA